MSDNRLECNESIGPLRPMLYFGDRENPIPEGMLPPEAFPYENSLDIELALNFFVERVQTLEREVSHLEDRLYDTQYDLSQALERKDEFDKQRWMFVKLLEQNREFYCMGCPAFDEPCHRPETSYRRSTEECCNALIGWAEKAAKEMK